MSIKTKTILNNYILLLLRDSSLTESQKYTYGTGTSKESLSIEDLRPSRSSDSKSGEHSMVKDTPQPPGTEDSFFYRNGAQAANLNAFRCESRARDCVAGRPLLFEGKPQLAQLVPGRDWSQNQPAARTRSLTPRERRSVGEYWLRTARLEHASVASFHQFSLDLLRFGAPPELLIRANKAAKDEIEHAQAAFALAESYLKFPLQPSAWELKCKPVNTWADFAESIAREAAINETLAVIMASVQLQRATDPAVRLLLIRIINEESEHAELAWDTLRWCLREGGPEVKERLKIVFSEQHIPSASEFPLEPIYGHGLPSEPQMLAMLIQGYEQVVQAAAQHVLFRAA